MKKLVCYFVLSLSLFCGVSGASSNKSKQGLTKEGRMWALQEGPRNAVKEVYEGGPKYFDLREKKMIVAAYDTIINMYPNRPDLQREAIDTWGQCMKEQKINGKRKYADRDANILVNFCKKKLDLN